MSTFKSYTIGKFLKKVRKSSYKIYQIIILKMKSLNIITITDGNLISLKKTLKSIDEQNYKNYKNYIISKKINY